MTDEPLTPDPSSGPDRPADDARGGGTDHPSDPAELLDPGSGPVTDDGAVTDDGDVPPDGSWPPPPTGPSQPAPPFRQLVRYPYSRLGGVATGIAYYFGLDPILVKIAFVLLGISTGFGVLAYILAWIIIPRATHWPPHGQANPLSGPLSGPLGARGDGTLSNRDIALGVLAIAFLVVLANGIGGHVFAPLALIGGGIWLLLQPERGPAVAGVGSATGTGHQGTAFQARQQASPEPDLLTEAERLGAGPWVQPPAPAAYVAPSTQPVPAGRRRRHRRILWFLVILGLVLLALPVIAIGAVLALIGHADIELGDVPHRVEVVDSADDLPLVVNEDGIDMEIDLTGLSAADLADLADLDEPAEIRVRADYGTVRVIVPDDLELSAGTDVAVGRIELLGDEESGIGSDLERSNADAVVDLRIDVDFGEVVVTRG